MDVYDVTPDTLGFLITALREYINALQSEGKLRLDVFTQIYFEHRNPNPLLYLIKKAQFQKYFFLKIEIWMMKQSIIIVCLFLKHSTFLRKKEK